jgi:uncharacterized protein (DUF433 family)
MAQQRLHIEELTKDEFEELSRYRPGLDWAEHIHIDPHVAFGKPTIRGTRISAELILELYAGGFTDDEVLENYPHLTREQIRAVFAYAAQCVSEKQVPPVHDDTSS